MLPTPPYLPARPILHPHATGCPAARAFPFLGTASRHTTPTRIFSFPALIRSARNAKKGTLIPSASLSPLQMCTFIWRGAGGEVGRGHSFLLSFRGNEYCPWMGWLSRRRLVVPPSFRGSNTTKIKPQSREVRAAFNKAFLCALLNCAVQLPV